MFKHQKLKILHLEDLASDALFVERELQKNEIIFETKLVDTKPAFINALNTFNPDIILSDHSLPSFNSYEALTIVQGMGYDIPFILLTGNVSEEFAVKMMKAGAWDYILKDRIQRLPSAIISAMEKVQLKKLQKKYLDEIIASDQMFKQAEKISHFGTWKYDLMSKRGTWSDENYRILGYETGEVQPTLLRFLRNIVEEDVTGVKHILENIYQSNSKGTIEFRVRMQDMSIHHIRSHYVVEKNEKGVHTGIAGFNHDITETKLAEESIYRLNANLQTIFTHTDTAFILIDSNLKIRSYNPRAEDIAKELFGRTLEEGTLAAEYFPEERRGNILSIMRQALNGDKISYEIDYPQQDGSSKWLDVKWIPIANIMNKKLGVIFSFNDIGGRKLAEAERENITRDLMHRNKDLQQFAYIVSHNLRSHLSNILGLSEVFKTSQEELSSGQWKQMIEMLDESCKKLDTVIRDLNNILEIRNALKESTEETNLEILIEDIKTALSLKNNLKVIDLQYDFNEVKTLTCLKSYLYSIFLNLITNSIKFKKDGRTLVINISAVKKKDYVELTFQDNGMGIDMQKRKDQVFGLYKRFHPEIDGKGMGLFMIKTQVETMGGWITVESEVEKGTKFIIGLPLINKAHT